MQGCSKILKKISVLYAEDEDDIREMLKDVIEGEFGELDTVKNGKEALKLFKSKKYDVVITDIKMPVMDGMEFAKEVRKISKNVPIIFLTAYCEKEKLFKAIDIGINKYLVKPFVPDKLLEVVCEIIKDYLSTNNAIKLKNGLFFYLKGRELFDRDGNTIPLTKKELLFVELLIKHRGRIVSIEEIERYVWSESAFSESALRALVKRVRQKTFKDFIKNFPRIGYKIEM
jgi:DNA-binding response OmpR family regulator